jgi:4-amino-4-deoxy-L-arabinose transferase-like glycosyltransferase
MAVSQEPIGGHLLFAVAYGFGGIVAAKLVHASVGLIAIAGVAGIAWLAAGRAAAMAGAAIFACMPVVLWLVGHAFLDLFPVLFTVTAVLSLLLWQRDGRLGWVVCAGVLAGSGAATKLPTMAIMIAAMVLAVVLVGRTPGHWPGRILAAALFGFSALVTIAPWLVRGYVTGGGLSLLNPLLSRLGATPPGTDGFLLDGPVEGVESAAVRPAADHSLPGLVRLPWDLTFNTGRFGFPIIRQGEVGFAGLAMLPLLVFAPRTRMMAFLAVTAAAALFGWWLTPLQVTRHPLPALAIVAAMAGAGFAGAIAAPATPPRRALAAAAWAGLIVACLAAIVFLLPARLAALPVDVVTGRQSAADYVARQLPLTPVLAAASLEIPADSVGAYIGRHTQVPRIYSDLQLNVYENAAELGATPEEIIANLDRLDMEYLVWNRYTTNLWGLGNWRAAIVSTPFLREHTRIVAGDDNAYVFALLPAEGKTWGVDNPRNVLADPDLDTVEADGPWQTVGTVRARKGVVSMRAESALAQPVPVTAGDPYLLAATATCDAPDDRAALSLRWFDDSGQEIDLETETVFPGTDGSEQFIWRRAPEHAASVSAEVASQSCRFDRVALYDLS